jgi:hypothetical protein
MSEYVDPVLQHCQHAMEENNNLPLFIIGKKVTKTFLSHTKN